MLRNKWIVSRKANDTPHAPGTEILTQVSIDNEDGTVGALVATVALHGTADIDNKYAAQIAAAPELLEALERLSSAAFSRDVTMGDPCSLLEAKAELSAANKQAKAAIAKAKGEV